MGTTYLELTNKVLRRLNEVELTSSDFLSARGLAAAAKDAIIDTVRKINTQKFEWPFNKSAGSQVLVAGTEEYTWPADMKIPDWESFYIENDGTLATETTSLKQISKEDYWRYFRNRDLDAGADGIGIPKYVFETSSGGFGVSPVPDAAYTVKFIYFNSTVDLTTYDTTCRIPTSYDHVIIDGALHYMYMFLDNGVRADIAEAAFKRGLDDMTYILIPKSPDVTDTRVNFGGGLSSYNGFYWGE